MNPEEIKTAVELHEKWLHNEPGGCRLVAIGKDLSGSDLRNSNLSGSNLRNSNLRNSNLRNSNLRNSNLSGSDLSGSNLSGSNLSGSNLRDSDLSGSKYRSKTIVGLVARVVRTNDPYEFFAWRMGDGNYINAGCRFMTVAGYREHAKCYEGSEKYAETVAILDFIEARFAATAQAKRHK